MALFQKTDTLDAGTYTLVMTMFLSALGV